MLSEILSYVFYLLNLPIGHADPYAFVSAHPVTTVVFLFGMVLALVVGVSIAIVIGWFAWCLVRNVWTWTCQRVRTYFSLRVPLSPLPLKPHTCRVFHRWSDVSTVGGGLGYMVHQECTKCAHTRTIIG